MHSLQRVLASIQLEQVCRYLANTGWHQSLNGARVDFEKTDASSQEACRVFLPASSGHPRFRQLLPNLVFSVSVVEEREPIQIATDIASLRLEPAVISSPPTSAPEEPARFHLRNSSANNIELWLTDQETHYQVPIGEEVLVLHTLAQVPVVELTAAASLRLHGAQVMLALPAQTWEPAPTSLRPWLDQKIPNQFRTATGQANQVTVEAERLLTQFCFAAEALEDLQQRPAPWLRASAVLLCGLSQPMCAGEVSQRELFQLARQLLSLARLTFALKTQQPAALWQIARTDCPHAPVKTLDWLTEEALPVSP